VDDALRRSAAHVLVDDVAAPLLSEPAWHHVRRVLRLRDGDAVTVTDGDGRWRSCRLSSDGVTPEDDIVVEPPNVEPLTVYVAMPKGDRADWLVQKCTEVGVDRIVAVTAERSVARWSGDRATRPVSRWRRIAEEAAMQARRVRVPELDGPVAATTVLGATAVAEPGGRELEPRDRAVAIGPEGGWSPAELAAASDQVSLGPYVLRVETAAVVAAARMVALRAVRP
jgi:16S rRNA (uracil1498-N3)-methyltransferase